jgi:hypothetical protein
MAIFIYALKKIQTKNLFRTGRTGQTGFFEYFGLYFFEINLMMAIRLFILFRILCSIRIWNQISKIYLNKRLKTKKKIRPSLTECQH